MQGFGFDSDGVTFDSSLLTFDGVPEAVVQPTSETPAGRKRKSVKRKVFVEQDGEILLFNSPQDAYDYLSSKDKQAVVKSVKTGKKVRKVKTQEFKPIEFDRIEIPKLQEFAETQRMDVDVASLIKTNVSRIIYLYEMMRDEEDVEILLLWTH